MVTLSNENFDVPKGNNGYRKLIFFSFRALTMPLRTTGDKKGSIQKLLTNFSL